MISRLVKRSEKKKKNKKKQSFGRKLKFPLEKVKKIDWLKSRLISVCVAPKIEKNGNFRYILKKPAGKVL